MLAYAHPLRMMFDTMDVMAACPRYSHSARCAPKLIDNGSEYTLSLSAAGVKKEDIKLTATDGVLNCEVKSTTWRLRLPRDADIDAAQADYEDGILTVHFPTMALNLPHPGVECDRSGMNPIVGKRYHLEGHNFDLCEAEYAKCGKREKMLYTAILPPPKRVKLDVPVAATADMTPREEDEEEAPHPYTLSLNAAGVKPSDLQLTIENSLLTVRGETKASGARLSEKHYRLPRDADAEKARATSIDGLLTLIVPKKVIVPVIIPINASMDTSEETTTRVEKAAAVADAVDEKKTEPNKADEEQEDAMMV